MHNSFSPANKIDLVFHNPKEDEYVVVIVHAREWDGSAEEGNSLKEKLNAYAQFLLGGQFKRLYPDAQQIRIQIDAPSAPPVSISDIVHEANNRLLADSIRVDFALV